MADSVGGWSDNSDSYIYGAITMYSVLHVLTETFELPSETHTMVMCFTDIGTEAWTDKVT